MSDTTAPANALPAIYDHLQSQRAAPYKSLFNALNREDISAIIMHRGKWWAEGNSTANGLTPAQHRTLSRLMLKRYGAAPL